MGSYARNVGATVVVPLALVLAAAAAILIGGEGTAAGTPPTAAGGCTRYAAPGGRDGANGTLARPFRTPQHLVQALRPGGVGCLRGGTYTTSPGKPYVLDIKTRGVRLRSYPGERAHLVGIVVVRNTASSVVLSHLEIEGDGTANTVKIYAADVTVEDSVITNAARGWSCMILGSNEGWGQAVRTIVRRNTFHDCGNPANDNKDHAIYAQAVVDGRIVGNVFWRTSAYAIHLYPNAQRTLVSHNVIDGGTPSVRGGIVFGGDDSYTSNDNVVVHNVIFDAVAHGISASWAGTVGTGNVARDNCIWRPGGGLGEAVGFSLGENVVAEPRFRDRARRDYRLALTSRCLPVVGYDAAARLRFGPVDDSRK